MRFASNLWLAACLPLCVVGAPVSAQPSFDGAAHIVPARVVCDIYSGCYRDEDDEYVEHRYRNYDYDYRPAHRVYRYERHEDDDD